MTSRLSERGALGERLRLPGSGGGRRVGRAGSPRALGATLVRTAAPLAIPKSAWRRAALPDISERGADDDVVVPLSDRRLRVEQEKLVFGGPPSRRRSMLRFDSDGARLVGHTKELLLPWEHVTDPVDWWSEGPEPPIWGDRWGLVGPIRCLGTFVGAGDVRYRVGPLADGVLLPVSIVGAASALCAFLRDVPSSRAGLGRAELVKELAARLGGGRWYTKAHRPATGARLDVHRHLLGVQQQLGVHCYLGRLVDGEVSPGADQIASLVADGLPSWVNGKATERESIVERYEVIRQQRPWPFAVLLAGIS